MPLILVMAGFLVPITPAVEMQRPSFQLNFALAEVKPSPLPTVPELIDKAALAAGVSTSTARAIAWCESHYRQFKDGVLLRGEKNPQDVGVMQINEYYHLADSKRLGYDIYTTQGNLAFGMTLLKSSGTAPWSASAECWKPLLKRPQLITTLGTDPAISPGE